MEWDDVCVDLAVELCLDCDEKGKPGSFDVDPDCNDNGIPDLEEGPTFCVGSSPIPLDLIVVADPSGSDKDKMPGLCDEVFRTAVARLDADFDLRAAWVSVALQAPESNCHDWTMPLGTPVLDCNEYPIRTINDSDGEEWGDASAVLTTPYGDYPLGENDQPWDERDAVLILISISDEGPQDGNEGGACSCPDELSVLNLIQLARIENVQILPMPTDGTPACVYERYDPTSYMNLVADETTGSVVDARNWDPNSPPGAPWSSQVLSEELEAAIRTAVALSPRIVRENPCPGDLNGDSVVNGADLGLFLTSWAATGDCLAADFDGDGVVNGADLGWVLGAWGTCR